MPRISHLVLIICFCSLYARADEPAKSNEALRMGLRGPVHSQLLVSSTKLNPEVQISPEIFIEAPKFWVVFDAAGRLVEQSNPVFSEDEAPSIVRFDHDGAGNLWWSDGVSDWRREIRRSTADFLDIRTWKSSVLFSRETNQFNAEGRLTELTSYNAKGRVIRRIIYRYDAEGTTMESYSSNAPRREGQFVLQMSSKYDLKGELVQRIVFDASGQAVTTFSLGAGHLIRYWQRANCGCWNSVEVVADGITYRYRSAADGALETTVSNHRMSQSDIEPAYVERFSEDGSMAERVVFDYERDSWGNWTRRVVFSEDVNTGVLLPVQEDNRTIVYY